MVKLRNIISSNGKVGINEFLLSLKEVYIFIIDKNYLHYRLVTLT